MRSGELFAGVGGLGMAVDEVFGSEPAWFCEFDKAPSKVLAYRHPDIPNYGDVTAVNWPDTPRVNILAGGFPCQDVSLAGRRRGMRDGTRSGLWSEYVKAIDELRPDWVVIENVRGLLSADAAGNVEPCPWCLGDEGEQHALRALGAVLGDLAELGFDAEWTGIRASDVGAPHGRFRVFILAWPSERTVADTGSGRGRGRAVAPGRGEGTRTNAQADRSDPRNDGTPQAVKVLPTPVVNDMGDGKTVEWWDEWTAKMKSAHGNGNGHGPSLAIEAQRTLLPTPVVTDSNGARNLTAGRREGSQHHGGTTLTDAVTLLPTPTASEGAKGGANQAYGSGGATLSGTIPHLTEWGPYANAIRRWESVTDRPAPSPVRMDGKGGKARLNPELTEWMMGWPTGHVTDAAIGLTRAEQLKACGNGVVPQQAAVALRELLARPGVPQTRKEVAA